MSGQHATTRALSLMDRQVGADHLPCVVIEPIQGEGEQLLLIHSVPQHADF
jgi:hypothetical protein